MEKIILFNGPPRSGKDTAASYASDWFANRDLYCEKAKFSGPIKTAFAGMMDPDLEEDRDEFGELLLFAEHKEKPIPVLGNTSYRRWQIDFSEHFMKLRYGKFIFTDLLADRIRGWPGGCPIWLIPDSGFQLEVDRLSELFEPQSLVILRMDRPGTDFNNDSREYVVPRHPETPFYRIDNSGDLLWLKNQLDLTLRHILATWHARNLVELPSSKPSPQSAPATSSPELAIGPSFQLGDTILHSATASPSEQSSPSSASSEATSSDASSNGSASPGGSTSAGEPAGSGDPS